MSDAGESVVFRIEIDQPPPRSVQCFKGSIETIGMTRNGESQSLEKIANGIVSTMFLIGELGIGPDLASAQINHLQSGTQKEHRIRSGKVIYLVVKPAQGLFERCKGRVYR